MRAHLVSICLLVFASPLAMSAGVQVEDSVVVLPHDLDSVLVGWSAGPQGSSYRVYGATGGALTLLDETTALQSIVASGYQTYAVATLLDGEVIDFRTSSIPCVGIVHGVPPRVVIYDCGQFSYYRPL